MARHLTIMTGAGCALLLALLIAGVRGEAGPFRLDALALFLGVAVTLVSLVVQAFSLRHMVGDPDFDRFFQRIAGLTGLVLLLLVADQVLLFAGLWVAMGLSLAQAIGHVRGWPQARAAAALARGWLLRGSLALVAGLGLLASATGSLSIAGIGAAAAGANPALVGLGCAALGLAAAIQCGIFPFHRWLISSVVAPTPVSAFMHAGLVNAGGILLARFAPALETVPVVLLLVAASGAAAALVGKFAALVQSDVKRGLAASTTAQMGFMLLQCGLGLHAAAMAHLVLHGLTKASLFLGAGSGLAAARPPAAPRWGPAVVAALLGGAGFALASGKLDDGAGALLVLFAALAAAQAALALPVGPPSLRWAGVPAALGLAGLAYGGMVAAVEALLAGTPGLVAPQPPGLLHLAIGLVFLLAWLAVQTGRHRASAALHARLLWLFRPAASAITERREALRA